MEEINGEFCRMSQFNSDGPFNYIFSAKPVKKVR